MNASFTIRIALASALFGAIGCAPAVVAPPPQIGRRIAVLPPHNLRGGDIANADSGLLGRPTMTVADLLAQQARVQLAAKGFEVLNPRVVKVATKDRVPTSPQMAAQIMQQANLDAVALYIEVRRWEPTPDARGMKADGVIVALDVTFVDPRTSAVLWQVHRPSRPVPVYGALLTGQANVFVAETVMREVLAPLGTKQPRA